MESCSAGSRKTRRRGASGPSTYLYMRNLTLHFHVHALWSRPSSPRTSACLFTHWMNSLTACFSSYWNLWILKVYGEDIWGLWRYMATMARDESLEFELRAPRSVPSPAMADSITLHILSFRQIRMFQQVSSPHQWLMNQVGFWPLALVAT